MSKKDCNNYTLRQNEIIKLFSAISGTLNLEKIRRYLKKSSIFIEIGNENNVYLYDSLSANLVEIVDELKESIGSQLGSERITEKSISKYNVNKRLNIDETAVSEEVAKKMLIKGRGKALVTVPLQNNTLNNSSSKKQSFTARRYKYGETMCLKNKTYQSKRKSVSKIKEGRVRVK